MQYHYDALCILYYHYNFDALITVAHCDAQPDYTVHNDALLQWPHTALHCNTELDCTITNHDTSHLDPPADGQAVIFLKWLLEVFISEFWFWNLMLWDQYAMQ